jgi:hypothetical protein
MTKEQKELIHAAELDLVRAAYAYRYTLTLAGLAPADPDAVCERVAAFLGACGERVARLSAGRLRIRRIAELINESRAAVSDAERGLLEAALAATKEKLQ